MNQHARPRSITPDSFSVSPELLGKPLAGPARRAAAMLVDLLLVAILIAMGGGGFLGIVFAIILLRASARFRTSQFVPRWVRAGLRFGAALVVFLVAVSLWSSGASRLGNGNDGDNEAGNVANGDVNFGDVKLNLSFRDGAALTALGFGLRGENDASAARQRADSIVRMLGRAGVPARDLGELRDAAHDLADSDDNPVVRAAIDQAFAIHTKGAAPQQDSLARAYAAALGSGDATGADTLRNALKSALAGEDLENLQRDLAREKQQRTRLQAEVDRMENRYDVGVLFSSIADDLGLGFGWLALYFTGFLALMHGQTPGKRMFGLRVVRLDAKPIGWWIAFERFGGYAASATLGLLGFLQILWDRNRQGFHDKAVETVVIRL